MIKSFHNFRTPSVSSFLSFASLKDWKTIAGSYELKSCLVIHFVPAREDFFEGDVGVLVGEEGGGRERGGGKIGVEGRLPEPRSGSPPRC